MEFNEIKYKKLQAEELIGLKIKSSKIIGNPEFDDEPTLEITTEDNRTILIKSYYGGYTGNSEDEYPCFIDIKEIQ